MSTINGRACVAFRKNLYIDATDFNNPDLWDNLYAWTKTGEKFNGLTVLKTDQDWLGLAQVIQVKKGETYTFSVYARYESGTGKSYIFPYKGDSISDIFISNQKFSLNETWKRVTSTMTITSDGQLYARIERSQDNTNNLLIAGPKLERGATATPLTPAPVDKVFSNGVQVYGRNLLPGTSNQETKGIVDANSWHLSESSPIHVTLGQKFVYRIFITNDNTVDLASSIDLFSGPTWKRNYLGNVIKAGTSGYSSVTFTIPLGVDNVIANGVGLLAASESATTVYRKEEKLEFDTIVTPWTPASEDVM